ncbi:MAG: dipeptidase [Pseudoxanthomonas sp.]
MGTANLSASTLFVVAMFCAAGAAAQQAPAEVSERAMQIHRRAIVLDTHLDTPANFGRPGWSILDNHKGDGGFSQVDLPRMQEGGLDGGFWAIFTDQGPRDVAGNREARDYGLHRLVQIHEMVAAHPDQFELASTADDAVRIEKAGKKVVFISMENASPLASDPSLLDAYYKLGLRMVGVAHFLNNDLGDSSTDPKGPEWHGLSPLGRQLVTRANELGILLDASHSSDDVLDQLLQTSKAPIVLSHSASKALFDHPRNVDDARLRKLAAKGGLIHVNAYGGYLVPIPKVPEREAAIAQLDEKYGPETELSEEQIQARLREQALIDAKYPVPHGTFDDFMRHLLHILEVAGPKHVGIGADWDGGGGVDGMEDVSALPKITERLLQAGYTEQQIDDIWGGNLLRVLREVQAVAEAPPR